MPSTADVDGQIGVARVAPHTSHTHFSKLQYTVHLPPLSVQIARAPECRRKRLKQASLLRSCRFDCNASAGLAACVSVNPLFHRRYQWKPPIAVWLSAQDSLESQWTADREHLPSTVSRLTVSHTTSKSDRRPRGTAQRRRRVLARPRFIAHAENDRLVRENIMSFCNSLVHSCAVAVPRRAARAAGSRPGSGGQGS